MLKREKGANKRKEIASASRGRRSVPRERVIFIQLPVSNLAVRSRDQVVVGCQVSFIDNLKYPLIESNLKILEQLPVSLFPSKPKSLNSVPRPKSAAFRYKVGAYKRLPNSQKELTDTRLLGLNAVHASLTDKSYLGTLNRIPTSAGLRHFISAEMPYGRIKAAVYRDSASATVRGAQGGKAIIAQINKKKQKLSLFENLLL